MIVIIKKIIDFKIKCKKKLDIWNFLDKVWKIFFAKKNQE